MKKESVDTIICDATIYLVNENFETTEAMAIKDGRIVATGPSDEIKNKYISDETVSLKNHFIYPGLHDPHCHFLGYGLSLNQVNLAGTQSTNEILDRCKKYAETNTATWITGRGWDQNDWEIKEFPNKELLDGAFPNNPVLLRRIDGHAAWANSKALELAGVNKHTVIEGGTVILENDEPSGILIDNAIDLVGDIIPEAGEEEIRIGLLKAQENCFAVGLTSVSDAGLSFNEVSILKKMYAEASLKIRIDAWLNPSEENFTQLIPQGVYRDDYLRIGTLKLYADGALGSRGARMLEDYSDDPGNKGLFVTELSQMKEYCSIALEHNYQVAVHCIGDAANRRVLNVYASLLAKDNDRRWRIEHSQVIHPDDFKLFGDYHIVPSIQTTHATSDMYWAENRVGSERITGAYAYQTLLQQNGWLPNGSDFPVEYINPLYGFYAAVSRKDRNGLPEGGFYSEESLSREQAMRAMTIWAAKACFEENNKGSLESNKLADFIVTEKDLMKMPENEIHSLKISQTWTGGKQVYKSN